MSSWQKLFDDQLQATRMQRDRADLAEHRLQDVQLNFLATTNALREELEAVEYDLKCTQRERGYNLARAQAAEDMLREVLDFLEHAPISGFDEGDVRGGEMHNALVEKIKKTLKHPAIVYAIGEQ